MTATTARNASLNDLYETLSQHKVRSRDIVVPASKIRAKGGQILVKGADPEISDEGVTNVDGLYQPTRVFDEGLADKLGIPQAYLTKTREQAIDLFDANVNGWLHGRSIRRADGEVEVLRAGETRKFMIRTLRGENGEQGIARALLSDRFRAIDNIDMLVAALTGIEKAGLTNEDTIVTGNLTDRRMYLDVTVPSVSALAPVLLEGYRSPFEGANALPRASSGADALDSLRGRNFGYGSIADPVVFVGFRIGTSEVGQGSAYIEPLITVLACTNGMTIPSLAIKYRHSGGKLDEGVVAWSGETYRKTLELITSQTADAAQTFLSPEFLAEQVALIEAKAGKPITEPEETVRDVTKALGFSKAEQAGVLRHFLRGGQDTAGGLLNAVTSYSQTVENADRAAELEDTALLVLDRV